MQFLRDPIMLTVMIYNFFLTFSGQKVILIILK